VTPKRPQAGGVVTFRVTSRDERPRGYFGTEYADVFLQQRIGSAWKRVPHSAVETDHAGVARLRYRWDASGPVVDPDAGYQQLALWDEHTWGAANSWHHADHGAHAGQHQWYWKVARAYEALDASDHALQRATGGLGRVLPRAEHALASLYVFNTTATRREDEVEVFLPASIADLTTPILVTDSRTGQTLPHTERDEPAGSRGLGRYLRCRVGDVPPVGFVRVDITEIPGERTDSSTPLADPTLLQNEALTVRIDLRTGTLSSVVDRTSGRELVNGDAALGFNHYVYDRYATVGQSNHNSSKFADIGNLALISSREVG
jgi:hypothetical protein